MSWLMDKKIYTILQSNTNYAVESGVIQHDVITWYLNQDPSSLGNKIHFVDLPADPVCPCIVRTLNPQARTPDLQILSIILPMVIVPCPYVVPTIVWCYWCPCSILYYKHHWLFLQLRRPEPNRFCLPVAIGHRHNHTMIIRRRTTSKLFHQRQSWIAGIQPLNSRFRIRTDIPVNKIYG